MVVGWHGAWLWGCVGVGSGRVMVVRWSMGDVGGDEGDVRVCIGGGYVMVAMCGCRLYTAEAADDLARARGCGGVCVLVVVV